MGNANSHTSGQSEFFGTQSRFKKRVSVPAVLPTYETNRQPLYSDMTQEDNDHVVAANGLIAVPFSQGKRKPQPVRAGAFPDSPDDDHNSGDTSSIMLPSEADTEVSAHPSKIGLNVPRLLPDFDFTFQMDSFRRNIESSLDSIGSATSSVASNINDLPNTTIPTSSRHAASTAISSIKSSHSNALPQSKEKIILKNPAIVKLKKAYSKDLKGGISSNNGSQSSLRNSMSRISNGSSVSSKESIARGRPFDTYSLHSLQSGELFQTETERSTPMRQSVSNFRVNQQHIRLMNANRRTDSIESIRLKEAMNQLPMERNGIRRPTETRAIAIAKFRMVKFNSTSTLFVDTTIINADLRESIRYASLYLASEIQKTIFSGRIRSHGILNEEEHPLSSQIQFYHRSPSADEIFRFVDCLFQSAELNVECVIITIVYVQRMMQNTGTTLHTSNWSRIVLGAVILASKVWDDHAVWNVDYTQIFPEIDVNDLNELERFYLKSMQFDVSVKISEYARLYFDLREMADLISRPWALKPLMKHEHEELQIGKKPSAPPVNPTEDEATSNQEEDDNVPSPITQPLNLKLKRSQRKMRRSFSDYVFVPIDPPAFVM